jgi:hypothetical protein
MSPGFFANSLSKYFRCSPSADGASPRGPNATIEQSFQLQEGGIGGFARAKSAFEHILFNRFPPKGSHRLQLFVLVVCNVNRDSAHRNFNFTQRTPKATFMQYEQMWVTHESPQGAVGSLNPRLLFSTHTTKTGIESASYHFKHPDSL